MLTDCNCKGVCQQQHSDGCKRKGVVKIDLNKVVLLMCLSCAFPLTLRGLAKLVEWRRQ